MISEKIQQLKHLQQVRAEVHLNQDQVIMMTTTRAEVHLNQDQAIMMTTTRAEVHRNQDQAIMMTTTRAEVHLNQDQAIMMTTTRAEVHRNLMIKKKVKVIAKRVLIQPRPKTTLAEWMICSIKHINTYLQIMRQKMPHYFL